MIPLPNVSSSVLAKILEWCEHHKNEPLPPAESAETDDSRRKTSEIGEWDQKYVMTWLPEGVAFSPLLWKRSRS